MGMAVGAVNGQDGEEVAMAARSNRDLLKLVNSTPVKEAHNASQACSTTVRRRRR